VHTTQGRAHSFITQGRDATAAVPLMITQRKYHYMLHRAFGARTCPPVCFVQIRDCLVHLAPQKRWIYRVLAVALPARWQLQQHLVLTTLSVMFGDTRCSHCLVWCLAVNVCHAALALPFQPCHATAGTVLTAVSHPLPFLYSSPEVLGFLHCLPAKLCSVSAVFA
jgi:hypothetical protein